MTATQKTRLSGDSFALIGLGSSDGAARHPNFNSFLMGCLRLAEKVRITFPAIGEKRFTFTCTFLSSGFSQENKHALVN